MRGKEAAREICWVRSCGGQVCAPLYRSTPHPSEVQSSTTEITYAISHKPFRNINKYIKAYDQKSSSKGCIMKQQYCTLRSHYNHERANAPVTSVSGGAPAQHPRPVDRRACQYCHASVAW
ncbi:hypothetical protein B5X24_HaOG208053 [Helicoverpa armigera]|nr:hypothetical protein B5X24_HaOG208053 [Helicoverpa armigera]